MIGREGYVRAMCCSITGSYSSGTAQNHFLRTQQMRGPKLQLHLEVIGQEVPLEKGLLCFPCKLNYPSAGSLQPSNLRLNCTESLVSLAAQGTHGRLR